MIKKASSEVKSDFPASSSFHDTEKLEIVRSRTR